MDRGRYHDFIETRKGNGKCEEEKSITKNELEDEGEGRSKLDCDET